VSRTPRIYTRLTRPTLAVGTYHSLWLATDHLLIVNSSGYTENYARVRFRDIKGFFLIGSGRRYAWGVTWAILAFLSALPLVVTFVSGKTPVFSVFFLAVTSIALLWNHLLGPSCSVFVVTGVQTALLPSIVRQAKARKVLARLEALVRTAQADLLKAPAVPPAFPVQVAPPA
jgi:hypothetical protein